VLGSTLVRCPSPTGSCNVQRVAPYWLPALPPRRSRRPRGLPRRALPWNVSPAICPRGVRCLFRVLGLRLRPPAPSPTRPLQEGARPFLEQRVRLSWGSCSPGHCLRRVPLLRHALPFGRSCGTGVATLPSVPSSGFLPLSTVPASTRLARGLLDPAVRRGPRRFAAFFHAARVPGASLQSFPFPGSRTRSRGPFLPCGFAFDCRRRSARGSFTVAFPVVRASSLPPNPPEGGPGTHEPGRRFLAIASPVASTRSVSVPHVPSPSH